MQTRLFLNLIFNMLLFLLIPYFVDLCNYSYFLTSSSEEVSYGKAVVDLIANL